MDYIFNNEYTLDIVDIIPTVVANALNINVCIITAKRDNKFDITKIPPGRDLTFAENRATISLIRSNHNTKNANNLDTHYDAAVPFRKMRRPLNILSHLEGDCILECPKTKVRYHLFRSPSFLSNFAHANICLDGVSYSCNEQNIMANRFPPDHPSVSRIMSLKSPVTMKRIGDKAVKSTISDIRNATLGMWQKYTNNPLLKTHLLSTGNDVLIEGTHNKVWGIGRDIVNDPSFKWTNRAAWQGMFGIGILGVLSMIIREDIRSGQTEPSWPLIEALLFPQSGLDIPSSPSSSPHPNPKERKHQHTNHPITQESKIPKEHTTQELHQPSYSDVLNGKQHDSALSYGTSEVRPLMEVTFPQSKLPDLQQLFRRLNEGPNGKAMSHTFYQPRRTTRPYISYPPKLVQAAKMAKEQKTLYSTP